VTKCPHCQEESGFIVEAPISVGHIEYRRRFWFFGAKRPVVIMRVIGAMVRCLGCTERSALIDDRGRVIPKQFMPKEEERERRNGTGAPAVPDSDLRMPFTVR